MMMSRKLILTISLLSICMIAKSTELTDAAKQGDMESVMSLIKSGANVNQPSADGTTALAHAAWRNDQAMLEYLLINAEAEMNTANEYGATALYLAAANAEASLIENLLKAGALPNLGLLSGETPLMAAANRGRFEAVKLLLEYGADPNIMEVNRGQNALMWAVAEGYQQVAELLIKQGADVNVRSNSGFTPLLFAARQAHTDIVKILLDAGANVDDAMCKSGPAKRIRYEDLAGINKDNMDCESNLNALMIASIGGFEEVQRLLLEQGADPNGIDKAGRSVLHVGAGSPVGISKALLEYGANPNIQLKNSNLGGRYGARVTMGGATPLISAASVNNLDVVFALLDAGADPFIATEQNTTVLMMAAGAAASPADSFTDDAVVAATNIVKRLVELGANVNEVGPFGWTALHAAAYQGRNDIIKILIENGANPNIIDIFGQTPLSISYALVTEGMGDNYNQTPRIFRKDTADLFLTLGAKPLEASGVKVVAERAIE
ncbi:MAG: ankyrin repeat domain-containing protein [Gammaproteobacteria bacterium]|jgi:ankyrin repeat protein